MLDSLDLFIKPFKNPILSKYFISLTSITQEEVDTKGISLKVAMGEFVKWCGRLQLYSYGPDHERLIENCALIDIPFLLKKKTVTMCVIFFECTAFPPKIICRALL